MALTLPQGMEIKAEILPAYEDILTPEALALVAKLHRTFEPRRQQLLATRLEGTVQLGDQRQCFGGQNVFVSREDLGLDLHALGQRERHGSSPEDDVRVERVRSYGWTDEMQCLTSLVLPARTAADRACRGPPQWAPRRAPRADAPGD